MQHYPTSCRGPGKGLAVAPAVIPDKALAGGLVVFLGWDPAKGCRVLSVYLILNVFTKICMPPRECLSNPCPLGAVDSRVTHSVGVGRAAMARVLPSLLKPPPGKDLVGATRTVPWQVSCRGSPLRPLCSLWSWPWRCSSSLELRSYPGSPPLPCLVWWCPWLRLPVHSYRGTKSVPLFLYTDRSPGPGPHISAMCCWLGPKTVRGQAGRFLPR